MPSFSLQHSLNSQEFPDQGQEITIHAANIFAGLHSKVKRRLTTTELQIATPYDVSGDPFYIAIGEPILVEWDRNTGTEAIQKEFVVGNYYGVTDFLKNERHLPMVSITTDKAQISHHEKIEREFYRTHVQIPLEIDVEKKGLLKVTTTDLSGGGVAFLHERPLGVGVKVHAKIPIIGRKGAVSYIAVEGIIVNLHMIHPRQFRMGMKFSRLPERDRDEIIRHVNGCTGKKRSGGCKSCPLTKENICYFERRE